MEIMRRGKADVAILGSWGTLQGCREPDAEVDAGSLAQTSPTQPEKGSEPAPPHQARLQHPPLPCHRPCHGLFVTAGPGTGDGQSPSASCALPGQGRLWELWSSQGSKLLPSAAVPAHRRGAGTRAGAAQPCSSPGLSREGAVPQSHTSLRGKFGILARALAPAPRLGHWGAVGL